MDQEGSNVENVLENLGFEVVSTNMYTNLIDMINHINACNIMVATKYDQLAIGYMYARLQVYDTFQNLPRQYKPQLVIIGIAPLGLPDVTNLPTWEAFLRWLKA